MRWGVASNGEKASRQFRLAKSCIGDAEKNAVLGVLDREFLGMGTDVQEFEASLTEFFERPTACVINGTAALHLALQACGIGRADEVLVPTLTFVASFQAIAATGATPVPCDIDPVTFTLDWEDARQRITPMTRAVMPVHYTGGVGDLDGIYAMADSAGLRVIEDAAHAFGTTVNGRRVGSFGDVTCFSFDGIKNITSGEGGCIVSDSDEVIDQVRRLRTLGLEEIRQADPLRGILARFDVREMGWRSHMSNLMAAIGIQQLRRREEFASKRQALARAYDRQLEDLEMVVSIPKREQNWLWPLSALRLAILCARSLTIDCDFYLNECSKSDERVARGRFADAARLILCHPRYRATSDDDFEELEEELNAMEAQWAAEARARLKQKLDRVKSLRRRMGK